MASLNRVDLIGNLGADPEVRRLNDGSPVVNLRVACTDTWRDKNSGERKERTEWMSVVIFNEGLAKIAEQYLRKGSRVFISGSLQTRKWQDQSGQDRYTTEIVLQKFRGELQMLDNKNGDDDPARRSDGMSGHTRTNPDDARTSYGGPASDLDSDTIPF